MNDLLISTNLGLYCPAGDFYIDPWRPVSKAIVTHAHSDHASPGSEHYLTAFDGVGVLRARLGSDASIEGLVYSREIQIGEARVSLHPAGHILGSAQVRVQHGGQVWVVTGDYKTANDPTCRPLERLSCDVLITESTFGLPVYRWQPSTVTFGEINSWWSANAAAGIASVVYAYSLGKAQRLLSGLDTSIGPIYCHGAIERMNNVYRNSGVTLPPTLYVGDAPPRQSWRGALIIAPTSARGSPWLRRFGEFSSAFVSGWMQIRGARRRRSVDRGFALSDHADWPGLIETIRASGARRVLVTHGFVEPLVAWLSEQGLEADSLATEFRGELEESSDAVDDLTTGGPT